MLKKESSSLSDIKGGGKIKRTKMMLIISDLFSFIVSFALVFFVIVSKNEVNTVNLDVVSTYCRILVFLGVALVSIFIFWSKYRHYTYRKPFWDELKEVFSILFVMALVDMLLMSIAEWDYFLFQWFCIWIGVAILMPLFRRCTKILLDHLGYWKVSSVIIGSGENAKEAYLAINSELSMGFDVKAFIEPKSTCAVDELICEIPVLHSGECSIDELNRFKIFIALEYEQRELRDHWIRALSSKNARNISIIPATRGIPLYNTDVSHFFSHEVMMLRLNNNLARKSSRLLKRGFDIFVASALLTILAPVFFYVGWKVSRDGGSPIYGHERVGFNGKKFKCLKFRSMVNNSQEVLSELLENSAEARAEWEKDFKLKDDPRITKIGLFLRKTSLDELPQLLNVIKGEMSLVGPRPIIDEELSRYEEDADYYLMAKPGMSGLWQVSGRNDVDYDTRVYLDCWYVKNWSLWNDIAILFKTVGVVLKRDGAY